MDILLPQCFYNVTIDLAILCIGVEGAVQFLPLVAGRSTINSKLNVTVEMFIEKGRKYNG